MTHRRSLQVPRETTGSASRFDSEAREREKQASRDADERAVVEGRMSLRDLEAKNAFVRADRAVPRWKRAKPL